MENPRPQPAIAAIATKTRRQHVDGSGVDYAAECITD